MRERGETLFLLKMLRFSTECPGFELSRRQRTEIDRAQKIMITSVKRVRKSKKIPFQRYSWKLRIEKSFSTRRLSEWMHRSNESLHLLHICMVCLAHFPFVNEWNLWKRRNNDVSRWMTQFSSADWQMHTGVERYARFLWIVIICLSHSWIKRAICMQLMCTFVCETIWMLLEYVQFSPWAVRFRMHTLHTHAFESHQLHNPFDFLICILSLTFDRASSFLSSSGARDLLVVRAPRMLGPSRFFINFSWLCFRFRSFTFPSFSRWRSVNEYRCEYAWNGANKHE